MNESRIKNWENLDVKVTRKWYNFETCDPVLNEKLTVFLKASGIKYEKSGCYNGWHFETYCSRKECYTVDLFLDGYFESVA